MVHPKSVSLWIVFNLTLIVQIPQELTSTTEDLHYGTNSKSLDDSENIDGAPLSDTDNPDNEDLDGIPLDGAALLKHAYDDTPPGNSDIDGIPCKFFNS